MEKQLLKTLAKYSIALVVLLISTNVSFGATKIWTGASSSVWTLAANWSGGVPSSTDDVTIGVGTTFTNQPIITASTTVKSITFGPNNNGNTAKPITLTVTGSTVVLTVTGTITQNCGAGTAGSSSHTSYGTYTTTLTGTGSIVCTGSFNVGTNVAPASRAANIFIVSSQIAHLTIGGNLILNAVGNNSTGAQNYPAFNLDNNMLTLNGQFAFTTTGNPDAGTYAGTNGNYIGDGIFCANNNANITTLELTNNTPIKAFLTDFIVDFDNKGTGRSITIYDAPSGSQRVYTDDDYPNTGSVPDTYVNLVLSGNSTKVFDGDVVNIGADLTVSGGLVDWNTNDPDVNISGDVNNSTTITEGSGDVKVTGDWQNNAGSLLTGTTGTSGSTTVTGAFTNYGTVNCNAEDITINGTYCNTTTTGSATLTAGSGDLIFKGNYANGAGSTFTAGSGTVYFSKSSAQTLQDNSTNGTVFNKVTFNGGSTVTMIAGNGNFGVSPLGILTMTSPSKLVAGTSSAAYLTLNSDATGSAIVAAITGTSTVTGYVNVERFIQGSHTSVAKRGYRLLSSTVFTGNDGTSNVFDFKYLLNSVYVTGTGGTANGFNATTTTNSTIYLFREDDPPPPSITTLFYTSYNWKGVSKINNTNAYNIGTQKKLTTTNIADTTVTIPVANGFLFFFRGNNTTGGNHTTTGTQLTAPFNFPDDVTLTQTGTLNTGTINVRLWFAGGAGLGNNFSYTAANVLSQSQGPRLSGGFTLVGNPYPSTINWEKFNNTHASGAITGGGLTSATKLTGTIWVFNENSRQYETYIPLQGTDVTSEITQASGHGNATGSASNFIASGQGFFVKATTKGQTLQFTEAAKISSQVNAANVHNLMSKPNFVAAANASARRATLRLKLVMDSVNVDDIAVNLADNASANFVDGEDAEDLGGSGNIVALSGYTADSVKVAINTMPFPGKQAEIVQLWVGSAQTGTYQLTVPTLRDLPQLYTVWLKDGLTDDSVQLKEGSSYSFTIDKSNPASFGLGRFTLVFRQDPAFAYQLVDFSATKMSTTKQVQTVWNTKNEQSYTNFTVERSIDSARTFQVVGGMTSTGAGNYSLLDKKPVNGQNLYRLKQEDINNTVTYTNLVEIFYADNQNDKIHLYPNPATSVINMNINVKSHDSGAYDIVLTNSSGAIVKQAISGEANWQAGISNLRPGTYLVNVLDKKDKSVVGQAKFVKL